MLLNAEAKGGDAVKQPESLHHKPLVLKKQVAVSGDVQGEASPQLLLRMQRTRL